MRRVLDSYVIPWFGSQTSTVGDITYFMVHEWLLILIGRRRGEPEESRAQYVGAVSAIGHPSTSSGASFDHPELTRLTEVARVLNELIRASIGSLLIPTTRRIRWGHANRIALRADHAEATLLAARWSIDPDLGDDPLCDAALVAAGSNCSTSFVSAFSMRFLGAVRAAHRIESPLSDDRERLILATTTSRSPSATSTLGSCQRLGPSGLLYL